MNTETRQILAFAGGVCLGIFANVVPSLPEQRRIMAGENDADKTAVRDAWVTVLVMGGIVLGFMLAAGWHKRGFSA